MAKSIDLRSLDDQFEEQTVERIRALQTNLILLARTNDVVRSYATELRYSLEAGLLLASIHLVASLLEIVIRELVLYSFVTGTEANAQLTAPTLVLLEEWERKLEDGAQPQWSFSLMVKELEKQDIIESTDAENIKSYYKNIRIPIHHGLTRRFLRGHKDTEMEPIDSNIWELLTFGRPLRAHNLEERLEDEAIGLIEQAVAFMTKYRGIDAHR